MPDNPKCARCGAALAAFATDGFCSACLLERGLEAVNNPTAAATERVASPAEAPGTHIGRYKLLQQIGAGGMGTVWMAEQTEPVRRMVALKVIKPGLDSKQILARFEAERQALALMDHPNIAKVLDAGSTPEGRHYFVMELVKGIPLTKYCDEQRLSIRERLELFMPVCQAIQHAHQKGIIHRDIKPGNVLVALYDGRPVPKVIDFGIAKAMGQQLTEHTLFTEFGAVIGTLEYMSPEQAELNQLDIDTRSDIYSLGVLLYQLLTGTTPITREALGKSAFDEILRRVREEEPPKPSTRLSNSKDRLASISAQRRLEPAQLAHQIRGDLDWIVMKALEKDRNRRYETANGLSADIRRHLSNELVAARPPSNLYRLQKTVRRHKLAFALAGGIACVVLASSVIATVLLVQEKKARRRATAAELEMLGAALKAEQFATAFIGANGGDSGWRFSMGTNLASLQQAADAWTRDRIHRELAGKPALQADLYLYKGRRFKTVETSGIESDPFRAATDPVNPINMMFQEIPERAAMLRESLRLREALYGVNHPAAAEVHQELAEALSDALGEAPELEEAEKHAVTAVAIRKKDDPGSREHAEALLALSGVLNMRGKPADAQAAIVDAIAIQTNLFHPQAYPIGMSHARLASLQQQEKQMEAARDSLKRAIGSLGNNSSGNNSSNYLGLSFRHRLVSVLRKCGNLEEAEQTCLQTLSMARSGGKDTATIIGLMLRELALIRKEKHDLAGAVEAARDALAAGQQQGTPGTLFQRVLGCLLSDLALAKITNGAPNSESVVAIMKHASESEDLLLANASQLIWADNPKNETAQALAQLERVYALLGRSNEIARLQRTIVQSMAEALNEAERLASGNQEMLKEVSEARARLAARKLKTP